MVLSIIVPAYNTAEYVSRCLESLVFSDFRDMEIIVVDDGSTDGTGDICDQYALRFPEVSVIHTQNSGVSAARNRGLKVAKGEYVCFVDSDDYLEKTGLVKVMNMLLSDKSLQLAVCGFRKIAQDGMQKEYRLIPGNDDFRRVSGNELIYRVFNGPGYVFAKIFKKDFIDGIWFDEKMKYSEDTKFLLDVMSRHPQTVLFNHSVYCYYFERLGNVTGEGLSEKSKDYLRTNRQIYETYKDTCVTVGMSRCFVAAKGVLSKMPLKSGYREYFTKVRETLKFSLKEVLSYLTDKNLRETRKQRIESLAIMIIPHISVLLYAVKMKGRLNNDSKVK